MDKDSDNSILPLSGIRVIDLGTFIAAPYSATVLGEFGAEVIKIEKPMEGDPLRAFGTPSDSGDSLCWLSEARNKRSVTLDLSTIKGANLLRGLVRKADIVCENFRPGTMEKWGLGFDQLIKDNPNLIMLRVSGFGQTGPLREKPGFARIAHAFGGLAHLTGMPGEAPLTPGSTSLADYISGLYGAIGILVALQARDKVGGQYIDLALYESIFRVLDDIAPSFAKSGIVRGRLGTGTSNACPHGHFKCGDGLWVALACSSDKIFARFVQLIGRPELAQDDHYAAAHQRLANMDYINHIVDEWLSGLTAEQAIKLCDKAGVPCAAIQSIADIFTNEQFIARENLKTLTRDNDEACVIPNVIPKLSKTPGRIEKLGPMLGDSNQLVFEEILGLSPSALKDLKDEGVI